MSQEKVEELKKKLKEEPPKEEAKQEEQQQAKDKEMSPEEFMAQQIHNLGHEGMFRFELLGTLRDLNVVMTENNKQFEKYNEALVKVLNKLQKEVDMEDD